MKDKELELTNILNSKIKDLNLINSKDKFSFYDSYNLNYIVEYKIRAKHYSQQFIQVDKLFNLLMLAEYKNKTAIYIVQDPKGIFIYNLNNNKDYFLKSNIVVKKCPYKTEFKDNKKINKYFYILNNNQLTKQL